jgi:hypothetical protein
MEEPEPAQVDVSWDTSRLIRSRPAYRPGHRTVVHIPFAGEDSIFHFLPSSHLMVELHARVADGELLLDVEYPDDQPLDITAHTEKFIERVETNLESARADISKFNSELEAFAMSAIEARRTRIQEHMTHLAATGLPIVANGDPSKTAIPEVITRRPAPVLTTTKPDEPMALEPVLVDEHYEHILAVIRQHSRSMQGNPQAYADMGEDARRHVIVDALNTHYKGAGAAEAFNFGGKTDILVSHDGKNLFIGECKFWSGAEGFRKTLDQLFGYQAWRDPKLAALMFVRERDLSTIIERGRVVLEAHPQFVAWRITKDEQELGATVSGLGAARRHADLNVFFIHVPESS